MRQVRVRFTFPPSKNFAICAGVLLPKFVQNRSAVCELVPPSPFNCTSTDLVALLFLLQNPVIAGPILLANHNTDIARRPQSGISPLPVHAYTYALMNS